MQTSSEKICLGCRDLSGSQAFPHTLFSETTRKPLTLSLRGSPLLSRQGALHITAQKASVGKLCAQAPFLMPMAPTSFLLVELTCHASRGAF